MAKMWLLIGLLILASAGCTRRDWVGDMLVLTDVTGAWSGTLKFQVDLPMSLWLKQGGSQVTGEAWMAPIGALPAFTGHVQGVVNGESFGFSLVGSSTVTGVVTVDGDEMVGVLDIPAVSTAARCPCRVHLRRSGPAPTPRPQP